MLDQSKSLAAGTDAELDALYQEYQRCTRRDVDDKMGRRGATPEELAEWVQAQCQWSALYDQEVRGRLRGERLGRYKRAMARLWLDCFEDAATQRREMEYAYNNSRGV